MVDLMRSEVHTNGQGLVDYKSSLNKFADLLLVRTSKNQLYTIFFIISNNLKTLLQTFKASEHAKDAYVHKLRAMEKKAADLVIAKFHPSLRVMVDSF